MSSIKAHFLPTIARLGPLKRRHVEACVSLLAPLAIFRKYRYTRASGRRMLDAARRDGRSELIVASLKDKIVGFAWFVPRGAFERSGYLRLLAVDRHHHGLGIGSHLMQYLEKKYLKDGGIVLLTSSFNGDAQRFYKALGYRRIGEIPDYVRRGIHEQIYFKHPPRQY